MAKDKINKSKIHCPICNKNLIKKYISQHIKRQHKNDNYCKFVSRGMTYKNFGYNYFQEIQNGKYFCKLCNKEMNIYSKYKHFNTKMHISLLKNNNNSDTKMNLTDMANNDKKENNNYISPKKNNKPNDNISQKNYDSQKLYEKAKDIICAKKENHQSNNWPFEIKELDLCSRTLKSEDFSFSESDNKSCNNYTPSRQTNSFEKNNSINDDSSSSSWFCNFDLRRKRKLLLGPEAQRIEKEVDEVIRRIENRKKYK